MIDRTVGQSGNGQPERVCRSAWTRVDLSNACLCKYKNLIHSALLRWCCTYGRVVPGSNAQSAEAVTAAATSLQETEHHNQDVIAKLLAAIADQHPNR